MSDGPGNQPLSLQPWAAVCATAAAVLGLAALAGWSSGWLFLANLGSGNVPMAPSTAVAFLLSGGGILACSQHAARWRAARPVAVIAQGAVGLTALVLMFLSAAGVHPAWEALGFDASARLGAVPLGHMSPLTALCFLLGSVSFLGLLAARGDRARRRARLARLLAMLLAAMSVVLILGYLYGTPILYGTPFIPPAATTSVGFLTLGAALLGIQARTHPVDALESRGLMGIVLPVVFAGVSLGIVAAGFLYSRRAESQFRAEVAHQLAAVMELKTLELVRWRRERLGDASVIQGNPAFSELTRRLLDNPSDRRARQDLTKWLTLVHSAYPYDRVSLLDASGAERLRVPEGRRGPDPALIESLPSVLRRREVTFLDLHRSRPGRPVHLEVLAPIFSGPGSRRAIAAVALRVDAASYLYPLVSSWPTPSRSAETLLVRREGDDVVFLNDLRFRKGTALDLRLPVTTPDLPAAMAVLGKEGIVEGRDYRGVPVLACVRGVPESPWYLVARIDRTEVEGPLRQRLWLLVAFVVSLLVTGGAVAGAIWRRESLAFYRDRYAAAESLRASEERFRVLVDGVVDYAIYLLDTDGRVASWNLGAKRLKGYAPEEIVGQPVATFFSTEDQEKGTPQRLLETASQRERAEIEGWCVRQDGSRFWEHTVVTALRNQDGSLQGFAKVTRDLTERRRAEERLRHLNDVLRAVREVDVLITHEKEQQTLLRRACEILAETRGYRAAWVLMPDDAGRIRTAARSARGGASAEHRLDALDHTSWPRCCDEALRQPGVVVVHDTENDCASCPLADAHRETAILAGALRHEDRAFGVLLVALASAAADNEQETSLFGELAADVGFALHAIEVEEERRRAEEARDTGAAQRQLALDAARLGWWHFDPQTEMAAWDDRYREIVGVEGYARPHEEILARLHPDDRPHVGAAMEAALDPADPKPYSAEYRIRRPNGQERWVEAFGLARFSGNGAERKATSLVGTVQDITERKESDEELRRLNTELEERVRIRTAQLEAANKELEAFSYSVSHDLRSPLRGIDGWSLALLEDYRDRLDEQAREYLDRVRAEAQRMGQLIDDLLQLARVGRAEIRRDPVDLSRLARTVLGRLEATEPERKVDVMIEPGLVAQGDARLIDVLLTNLLGNAWKFTTTRSSACIEVGRTQVDGGEAFFVRDNGVGFDMRYATKLFGAFQRMHRKSEFPGTGIGLATAQRIVHRHGGRVWAEAEVERGATFYFTLEEGF